MCKAPRPAAGPWRHGLPICSTAALMVAATLATGCRSAEAGFDVDRARAHVAHLAGTIGRRPAGSRANELARAYLIDALQSYGFDVRVQQTDAEWPENGTTARVANLIAVRPGASSEAIGLVAHYDSRPWSPGAGDDAFGVATALEAARILAERRAPHYSLMVLLTDAEEDGLMGARALVADDDVRGRLRTFLNLEAIGSAGPVPLFETAAGTGPALRAWAASARPRGGSYMLSIYEALPNDTDATVLRTLGLYGLNFAAVGNSHVYHTDRDLPEHLEWSALKDVGDNIVSIVETLDAGTLESTDEPSIYFSVLNRTAFVVGRAAARTITIVAVALGLVAVAVVAVFLLRTRGWLAVGMTAIWATAGTLLATLLLIGSVWLLRASREELHPWYSTPERFFALMIIILVVATWVIHQLARRVSIRLRPVGTPSGVWLVTLPVWLGLAVVAGSWTEASAYLVAIPLLAAAVAALVGVREGDRARVGALGAAVVAWMILAIDAWTLLQFSVATFGRLPMVTPTWLLPGVVIALGVLLWPPCVAVLVGLPVLQTHRRLVTRLLATSLAVVATLVAVAPGYTRDRPLRAVVTHVDDRVRGRTVWRVAANEATIAATDDPAVNWRAVTVSNGSRPGGAFAFEATAPSPRDSPAVSVTSTARAIGPGEDGLEIEISLGPHEYDRLSATFTLPAGIVPASSTLVGLIVGRRWQAHYVNVPNDGLVWRATLAPGLGTNVIDGEVRLTRPDLPGDDTPGWLRRENVTWQPASVTVLPVRLGFSS